MVSHQLSSPLLLVSIYGTLFPRIYLFCVWRCWLDAYVLCSINSITGIKVGRQAPELTHLFFADDALLFFKATPESCGMVRQLIDQFCSLFGQMVSFEKSFVEFSENTPSTFVQFMKKPLGVPSHNTIDSYLGCPMEVTGRNVSTLNGIVDKLQQRIFSWQFANLSPAGRLLLANAILVYMASHIMSFYLLPKKVTKTISSAIIQFWWRGLPDTIR